MTTNSPWLIENVRAARCAITRRRSRSAWSGPSRASSAIRSTSSRSGAAAWRREISGTCDDDTRWLVSATRTAASDASAAFEAKSESQVARARELYVADRDRYRTPEEVSASHILFDIKKHSSDDARKLAVEARAKIVSGAAFNELAKQVSEDPSVKENAGRLGWFTRDRMDAAFSRAAFALKQEGDISEPVQSGFGWHIIRLDGRRPPRARPFEEVRDSIVAGMKKTYVDQQRDAVLNTVRNDPTTRINDEEVKALVEHTMAPTEHSDSPPGAPAPPPK